MLLLTRPSLFSYALPHRRGLASMALIEVERKYVSLEPTDLAVRIRDLGGSVVGSVAFNDVYYDTSGCVLTRRDMWLRKRDSSWELKLPIEADAKRSGGERTVFREVEGEDAVAKELDSLLPDGIGPVTEGALDSMLAARGVAPFAEFSTTRAKFKLGKAAIDADVASFGHSVLEIEILCRDPSEVDAANSEIDRVAEQLGVTPLGAIGGKLETYIRNHCPAVLKELVDAGILQAR